MSRAILNSKVKVLKPFTEKQNVGESDLISTHKVKTAIATKLLTSKHPKFDKMQIYKLSIDSKQGEAFICSRFPVITIFRSVCIFAYLGIGAITTHT